MGVSSVAESQLRRWRLIIGGGIESTSSAAAFDIVVRLRLLRVTAMIYGVIASAVWSVAFAVCRRRPGYKKRNCACDVMWGLVVRVWNVRGPGSCGVRHSPNVEKSSSPHVESDFGIDRKIDHECIICFSTRYRMLEAAGSWHFVWIARIVILIHSWSSIEWHAETVPT